MFNMETTSLPRKILFAGILGASALATSSALAKSCKGVYVKAINQTGQTVTVTDLDYYDYEDAKWRSEPTVNKRVPNGQVWADTRNLGSVGGERIKIRIEYTDAYGNKKEAYSGKGTCRDRSSFSVVMTGPKTVEPPQMSVTIPITQGVYVGKWSNGQRLVEQIRRISNTSFTVKRRGGGNQPVLYTLSGKDTYRNSGGSRIVVTSNGSFVWMNASGGNRVNYHRAR